MLCVRHYSKWLTDINSCDPQITLWGRYYYYFHIFIRKLKHSQVKRLSQVTQSVNVSASLGWAQVHIPSLWYKIASKHAWEFPLTKRIACHHFWLFLTHLLLISYQNWINITKDGWNFWRGVLIAECLTATI